MDDVDARVAGVAGADGAVLAGPMDAPTVGRMAIVRDPAGGVIGIIEYADADSGERSGGRPATGRMAPAA